MSWKTVKLGDVLKRRRETIKILPDQEYKLVTIKLYHKGVVLRSVSKGSDIKSTMSTIKAGDFILSGIDARNGAFGIVPNELEGAIITNDFWCLDPDETLIEKEFLLFLTSTDFFDHICKQSSDGTTQRIRLQKDKFFNFEIDLPPLEEQKILTAKFKDIGLMSSQLSAELTHQLDLVKQLRQAFLREAMQGKLTPSLSQESGQVETGQQLLTKIKAEKAQLIAAKKLKKEKDLPPIKPEEIPFEIPKHWTWCRLGEIALYSEAGKSYQAKEVTAALNQIGVIKTSAITSGIFLENENKLLPDQNIDYGKIIIEKDDLIFCRASGSKGLAGKSCLVINSPLAKLILSDKSVRYVLSKKISKKFIQLYNSSIFAEEYYNKLGTGKSTSMNNITRDQFDNLSLPLPPLSEQQRIVEKLESLMQTCDALEASIKDGQRQNEQLLQQVLREALRK